MALLEKKEDASSVNTEQTTELNREDNRPTFTLHQMLNNNTSYSNKNYENTETSTLYSFNDEFFNRKSSKTQILKNKFKFWKNILYYSFTGKQTYAYDVGFIQSEQIRIYSKRLNLCCWYFMVIIIFLIMIKICYNFLFIRKISYSDTIQTHTPSSYSSDTIQTLTPTFVENIVEDINETIITPVITNPIRPPRKVIRPLPRPPRRKAVVVENEN